MKLTKVLAIVVGLCIMYPATAQLRFDLGLKGGLNFANIDGSASITQNYKNRTGYHVGAYALFKFAKFGIQPEIVFSRQGQSFSYNTSTNLQSNFDYINIPIMFKFYMIGGLNLQAGPQFGFLASSKGDIVDAEQGIVINGQSLSSFVKSSDVSLGLGLGWDLPFGLSITGRYNLGLSDINNKTGIFPSNFQYSGLGDKAAKNQVIQFSVGYRIFKIGH